MDTYVTSIQACIGERLRRVLARVCLIALAALLPGLAAGADPKLLPPEEAFRFSARALDERTIEARFAVAEGYYLYRDRIRFAAAPEGLGLTVAPLPEGKPKDDPFFGKVDIYRNAMVVKLALNAGAAGQSVVVTADSQGCADLGVCYPPNLQKVTLVLPGAGKGPGPVVDANPPRKRWFN